MSVDKKIAAGKFKAQCLKLMDEVNKKKFELVITKRGKPVAKLVSLEENKSTSSFGCMRGTAEILDHFISAVDMPDLMQDPAYQAAMQSAAPEPVVSTPQPAPPQVSPPPAPPEPASLQTSVEVAIPVVEEVTEQTPVQVPPAPPPPPPASATAPEAKAKETQAPEPSFNQKWTQERIDIYKQSGGENSW